MNAKHLHPPARKSSAVLGASIVSQVAHLEGVVAVRDRFTYPAPSA